MDHNHSGDHHHALEKPTRAFQIAICINFLFVLIEFYYGSASKSLALTADAGHNLGDVLGLMAAWIGYVLMNVKASHRFSFEFKKISILIAFMNSLVLLLGSVWIAFEAFEKYKIQATEQNALIMIVVAAIGIGINFSTAMLFHKQQKHDLNMKSAYLHLMADAAISLGVVISGLLIYYKNWYFIDPILSFFIAAVIFYGTFSVFKESFLLLINKKK